MNNEELKRFRTRVNSPILVKSEMLRDNFNFLLDEIEKLQTVNKKHIEIVTEYAIENQKLKEENKGYEKINHKQAVKIIDFKSAIKQTIEHLETHNPEEDIETFHDGIINWLHGVLERKW